MSTILAIDPGPTESAWVAYVGGKPVEWGKWRNDAVLQQVWGSSAELLAVEMIASYGMAVGAEVFDTCVWIGRYIQAWQDETHLRDLVPRPSRLVYRREVKLHLCGNPRAKDTNVRQALIDRYGPGKDKAIGKKATPGPLYGMKADCWQALGVAVTAAETGAP